MTEEGNSIMKNRLYIVAIVFALTALSVLPLNAETAKSKSHPIVNAGKTALVQVAGVKGGVVVSVGWENDNFLTDLYLGEQYIVQGVNTDTKAIAAAREAIKAAEWYGPVSAVTFDGNALPYIDNSVNLLVITETFAGIPVDEVERVLTPGGRVLMKQAPTTYLGGLVRVPNPELTDWVLLQKPVSPELDEWTHYLHGSDNNAVSKDSKIGPPGRMQWVGGERKTRHHENMSSFSACVSAGGRVFYIIDEADRSSMYFSPKWKLIACDAYNGKTLWKRDIVKWHSWLWQHKSGPARLTRKLVAVGDKVYVTLEKNGALSLLDASTGETIRTFLESEGTEEFIVYNDIIYLVRNDGDLRYIEAYAANGARVWSVKTPIMPNTLAASKLGIFYHNGDSLQRRALSNGDLLWTSPPILTDKALLAYPDAGFEPKLVVYGNVVLFEGGSKGKSLVKKGNKPPAKGDEITAVDASSGKILWVHEHPKSGYASPEDILVTGGLVWFGDTSNHQTLNHPPLSNGEMFGYDPSSGKLVSKFLPDVETFWFHHRCYPAKATEKYLLTSRTGVEFIDYKKKTWEYNHWIRGACLYGIMPANGLIYTPPNPCNCFPETMYPGFNALASSIEEDLKNRKWNVKEGRLIKGPAYGRVNVTKPGSEWWPTYRHDAKRSGTAGTDVPSDLTIAWRTKIGRNITQTIIADGKVFVAGVDNHTVYALESKFGKVLWTFTVGARVDSPPTYHKGTIIFGSADGRVYCVRASDGELVWSFLAASLDQRLMSYEQLESVWPVHGSILIRDNEAVFVAGRSMYLDGGLRLFRLNAATGEIISETTLDDLDPFTGKNMQVDHTGERILPVALTDILSCDDKHIYMRSQTFDLKGKRTRLDPYNGKEQKGDEEHLFCPTGFLDDTWHHRSYWVYGKGWTGGMTGWTQAGNATPSGRIMSFDDTRICGFSRRSEYFTVSTPIEYELFGSIGDDRNETTYRTWTNVLPILVRAMVMSEDKVFVAGPADVIDEEVFRLTTHRSKLEEVEMYTDIRERQEKLWEGTEGSSLIVVDVNNGSVVSEQKLDMLPIFDGFAAAEGKLFMSTTDGYVVCFRGKL